MKKLILILLLVPVLLVTLAVAAFRFAPTPKDLGDSERFSAAQIKDAANMAERYVKDFAGVLRVLRVTYDEAAADDFWGAEFAEGEKDPANTLTFFVDFATGANTTSLNIWDVYTDYAVTLTRETSDAPFSVTDAGY